MNITRYILPASIAAVLHTALLLAFPIAARPGVSLIELPLAFHPATPPPVDPPPVVTEDESPDPPTPAKLHGAEPPVIPEPPARPIPAVFVIDVKPDIIGPDHLTTLEPPGRPDGVENGSKPHPSLFTIVDLDRIPRATVQIPPDYPSAQRQAGQAGEVVVEFAVDATGRVVTAQVLRSSRREFEEPTVRAVLKWRFEPGKRNGRAVPFRMVVPVTFSTGGV